MHELARDGRGRGDVRVGQAHLGLRRAHAPTEVAVRGRHRTLARGEHAHVAAEAGAAGRGRDARAGLDEDIEQALAHRLAGRCAGSPERRSPAVGVDAAAAQDLRRLAEVGHRPVRAVADVRPGRSRVPVASATGTTLPGKCGSATRGSSAAEVDRERLCERRVGVGGQLAGDVPGHGSRGHRDSRRPCRRAGTVRSPRRPRPPCSRRPGARRPTAPAPPRRRTRAPRSCAPPTPISPMTARIRSFPVTNALLARR